MQISIVDRDKKLLGFLQRIVGDSRLSPHHLALATALCQRWIVNEFHYSYNVSRNMLMKASRIRSQVTYHKVMKDLERYGYLRYNPSYHPKAGSVIILLFDFETVTS
ncbi:hypothetical protein [Pseudochryseolinea flava]|uniref:Uncharacterized protein n=1 Tax=Pseudochryseolinea flava TaxID=2059302 RepID=A0A364Y4K7_9BACT|nr:hypothetical protein [Pseudochryseolinea flava]RAW01098.1 hypothetical protein DQQ10_12785 [Pseudochryseolinea flava]